MDDDRAGRAVALVIKVPTGIHAMTGLRTALWQGSASVMPMRSPGFAEASRPTRSQTAPDASVPS